MKIKKYPKEESNYSLKGMKESEYFTIDKNEFLSKFGGSDKLYL